MKSVTKYLLLLLLGGGAMVFASGGLECDSCGEPPHGIGLVGNATGTKLNGIISIEFYNIVLTGPDAGNANARLVLRLRKGNKDFAMFYGETSVDDLTNPSEVQNAVIAELSPQVIDRFLGNNDGNFNNDGVHTVKIKSMEEFGELIVNPTVLIGGSTLSTFVLSNVEIAVQ